MIQIENNNYRRPEHIEICLDGNFEGIIKEIIFYGSFYEVTVITSGKELLVHSFNDYLEIGQKIRYKFNGQILKF